MRSATLPSRLALLLLVSLSAGVAPSSRAETGASDPDWTRIGNDEHDTHYSRLSEINDTNVAGLKLEWAADMPVLDGLVGVPLVADGVVYQSGPLGLVFANELATGKLLWRFDAGIKFPLGIIPAWGARLSRGLALWEDKVIRATGDCRLIAIDRRAGTKVWEAPVCAQDGSKTITGAPRVGDGKVFIGNANADSGVGRGHVDAFDAATGKHLWRFYTIPGDPAKGFESPAMEMASKTWGKEYWTTVAGGSVWEAMTYDPRTDMLIIGTDGPTPLSPLSRGEGAGDELFTNAVVALKADTGEYVWHYSTTPGDGWNYGATMPFVLSQMRVDGRDAEVVMTAPKNGFFYVLDARSGKLVNQPKPIATVNWASHIDMATGRPVMLPGAQWWNKGPEGAVVFPHGYGAHNWMPMAWSPDTKLVYIPTTDAATRYWTDPKSLVGQVGFDNYHTKKNGGPFRGVLLAWDPAKQQARWQQEIGAPYQGGTLATAGNLVFQGTTEGRFNAYRADTGEKLWSFDAGGGVQAAPSTVTHEGKQLVLVPTGSGTTSAALTSPRLAGGAGGPARLLAFSLTGSAQLPPALPDPAPIPQPPADRPDPELVRAGLGVWEMAGCELCHGNQAIGGPGSVPDLRRIRAERLAMFPKIIREGMLTSLGMPDYREIVAESDLPALRAYILEQAWKGHLEQAGAAGATGR